MGIGDWIMASGQVKGHRARTGRKVAFGNGHKARWSEVFDNNPNVASPYEVAAGMPVDWVTNYPGRRPYLDMERLTPERWAFLDYTPEPGEFYFTPAEIRAATEHGRGFVVIEPQTKDKPNKQWRISRYVAVARKLRIGGIETVQVGPTGSPVLQGARFIATERFREAAAILANASLYIGPEGGLHHAAAALGIPAVVIFGGFISPKTTGYAGHANLFIGEEACGMRIPCEHCRQALDAIGERQVIKSALTLLEKRVAA